MKKRPGFDEWYYNTLLFSLAFFLFLSLQQLLLIYKACIFICPSVQMKDRVVRISISFILFWIQWPPGILACFACFTVFFLPTPRGTNYLLVISRDNSLWDLDCLLPKVYHQRVKDIKNACLT